MAEQKKPAENSEVEVAEVVKGEGTEEVVETEEVVNLEETHGIIVKLLEYLLK